jgi:hypothetical protein
VRTGTSSFVVIIKRIGAGPRAATTSTPAAGVAGARSLDAPARRPDPRVEGAARQRAARAGADRAGGGGETWRSDLDSPATGLR